MQEGQETKKLTPVTKVLSPVVWERLVGNATPRSKKHCERARNMFPGAL